MDAAFCVEALKEALAEYGTPKLCNTPSRDRSFGNALPAADQGTQYTSTGFSDVLHAAWVKASMDGRVRWVGNVRTAHSDRWRPGPH